MRIILIIFCISVVSSASDAFLSFSIYEETISGSNYKSKMIPIYRSQGSVFCLGFSSADFGLPF
jgi:hypothetical protein